MSREQQLCYLVAGLAFLVVLQGLSLAMAWLAIREQGKLLRQHTARLAALGGWSHTKDGQEVPPLPGAPR